MMSTCPFLKMAHSNVLPCRKRNACRHFKIQIENILPFQVYQLLRMRMAEKFSHIANVSLTIESQSPVVNEQHLLEYWQVAIEQLGEMSPLLRENLLKQTPHWTGNKLVVTSMLDD